MLKKLVGVTAIRTKADYSCAMDTINVLLDEVGDDETHPAKNFSRRFQVHAEVFFKT